MLYSMTEPQWKSKSQRNIKQALELVNLTIQDSLKRTEYELQMKIYKIELSSWNESKEQAVKHDIFKEEDWIINNSFSFKSVSAQKELSESHNYIIKLD